MITKPCRCRWHRFWQRTKLTGPERPTFGLNRTARARARAAAAAKKA